MRSFLALVKDNSMNNNLELAIKVVKEAGELLKKGFNTSIKINSSKDKDIKLQADLDSEKLILNILNNESSISILSEEFGYLEKSKKDNYQWIVDPLDGSLNYSRSISISCISIGLWKGQRPVLGVIYDFLNDDLLTGIVGESAILNKKSIKVSEINKKSDAMLCTGFPVYSDFNTKALNTFVSEIQNFKKVRLLGSAAISLSLVARGAVEAYKEKNIAIWDVAAGIPIVLAAGGKCSFTKGKGKNLLNVYATNGVLE